MRKLISFFVLAIALSSCVSTQVTMLRQAEYKAVDPEQVQVFLSEEDVKVPFEKIALIHADADANVTKQHKMISAMKKKAAEIGAHAIIIGEIDEPSAVARVASQALFATKDVFTRLERTGQAVAIRFIEEETEE